MIAFPLIYIFHLRLNIKGTSVTEHVQDGISPIDIFLAQKKDAGH